MRKTKEEKIFNFVNLVFMVFFTIIIAFPLINIVALSFNDPLDALKGGIFLWPRKFTFESYSTVLENHAIYLAFIVSVSKTIVGIVLHTFVTAITAYALTREDLIGRKWFEIMGILTMFVNGGMIPTFLVFKSYGLLNNFWVYILPVLFSFYDVIIMMNFFRGIPRSLEESAEIDGATPFTVFAKIIIPLSLPVIATIALYHGVYQWNDYMTANIYVNNENLFPLQQLLYKIVSENLSPTVATGTAVVRQTTSQSMQLATMVITTIPVVAVYPFLQKYFVSGLTLGAVKK
ncbi:ABC transporter permease subunit [Schleiferilactobacillus harbinensis]|uniref:Multiple sugar transport system permease protein n=1 Tax=Schleiferilactobacillus harbinensis DSM 16991 TaxID=1122147 RepID=A0A0R1XC04_9LACO|nr:carbohydrate ABC transporter permease [Schleiferilactobacillus harbinensis]KRM27630.1 multiple sugar transport system permease protein [Schleiferilactobacillus harbinensis DSM 16991]QFR63318.1 ABC transporter permease subunit [Schleiferilactobacillus harbinensis]